MGVEMRGDDAIGGGLFSYVDPEDPVRADHRSRRGKNGFHLVVVTSTVVPGSVGSEIRDALESPSLIGAIITQ
jgi:hypothetical protein